jgi:hypothetical protein
VAQQQRRALRGVERALNLPALVARARRGTKMQVLCAPERRARALAACVQQRRQWQRQRCARASAQAELDCRSLCGGAQRPHRRRRLVTKSSSIAAVRELSPLSAMAPRARAANAP